MDDKQSTLEHVITMRYMLLCLTILCCTLVATCELTNRMLIETASINERAAEKGLEPYTPNPMNGIQKYQPKKESRDE